MQIWVFALQLNCCVATTEASLLLLSKGVERVSKIASHATFLKKGAEQALVGVVSTFAK